MSWDGHVQQLLDSGYVSHAAIFGLDGACWAASPGFQPTEDEIRLLVYAVGCGLYFFLFFFCVCVGGGPEPSGC